MAREIVVWVRESGDRWVWLGVGVCPRCDPAPTPGVPRRTFSLGSSCPECGGAGELEWRLDPDMMPGQFPGAGRFPADARPPANAIVFAGGAWPARKAPPDSESIIFSVSYDLIQASDLDQGA